MMKALFGALIGGPLEPPIATPEPSTSLSPGIVGHFVVFVSLGVIAGLLIAPTSGARERFATVLGMRNRWLRPTGLAIVGGCAAAVAAALYEGTLLERGVAVSGTLAPKLLLGVSLGSALGLAMPLKVERTVREYLGYAPASNGDEQDPGAAGLLRRRLVRWGAACGAASVPVVDAAVAHWADVVTMTAWVASGAAVGLGCLLAGRGLRKLGWWLGQLAWHSFPLGIAAWGLAGASAGGLASVAILAGLGPLAPWWVALIALAALAALLPVAIRVAAVPEVETYAAHIGGYNTMVWEVQGQGPDRGDPVIFLHGWTGDGEDYVPAMRGLSLLTGKTLIAVRLPLIWRRAYGDPSRRSSGQDWRSRLTARTWQMLFPALDAFVLEVCRHFAAQARTGPGTGSGYVILIAHSAAARTVMRIAAGPDVPFRPGGYLLHNPAGPRLPESRLLYAAGNPVANLVGRVITPLVPRRVRQFVVTRVARNVNVGASADATARGVAEYAKRRPVHHFIKFGGAIFRAMREPVELGDVVPGESWHGVNDWLTDPAGLEALKEAGFDVRVIEERRHDLHRDPLWFARELAIWLHKLQRDQEGPRREAFAKAVRSLVHRRRGRGSDDAEVETSSHDDLS